MKIVIACDSFKESMSASTACNAIKEGIMRVDHTPQCICIPMADGGEGTTEVLSNAIHAIPYSTKANNLYGDEIDAMYGMNEEGIAIMEVATTCGIDLVAQQQRNPTLALSFGLGQMIKDAINRGAKKIILGLGGSGTNDGGYGMLCALGAKFYDKDNQCLPMAFASIEKIERIDLSEVMQVLGNCELVGASDVENVFTGKDGATYVFGKQKGASQEQIAYLEHSLHHFQCRIQKQYQVDLRKIKKTGSAGGIGGALYLLGAELISGIELIMKMTAFEKHIQNADYIMTGEGSIDAQTINGKTISGIANMASQYNIPVIAFGGRVSKHAHNLYEIGVTAMFSITNEVKTLPQALIDGEEYLTLTSEHVFRLLSSGSSRNRTNI